MRITFSNTWFTRSLVLGSLAVLGFGLTSGMAYAQDDDERIEEITVTGSRIARDPNLGAPVAVQSVTAEEIRLSGQMDVAEVIKQIPALLTTTTGETSGDNTEFDSTSGEIDGRGESLLQLRGMGGERTLVLVNGRRHVSGVAGTQAVDINTIPQALIERVEVLTGGASAIYGADAVTGVVNFILKEDYEGLEFNAQTGISGEGDAETYRLNGIYGLNFAGDRGNFTVAVGYTKREKILFGDRAFSRNNGVGNNDDNPDLRFQVGDIGPNTPNFAQFYSVANDYFPTGFLIPLSDPDFIADYTAAFGVAPVLTPEETALIQRAANSPTEAIFRQHTFSLSANRGVIAPVDFALSGLDLDGNGNEDCLDSFLGYNSGLVSANSFGAAGGCFVINDDGTVRPYQDGLIARDFNHFGGDGIQDAFDGRYLIPDDEKIIVNLMARYDLTDSATVFGEFKYVTHDTEYGGPLNTFYDLLRIEPDNPFIPPELQGLASENRLPPGFFPNRADTGTPTIFPGGLYITRDPTDLGPNIDKNERETFRFVGGIEGEFGNGWNYEFTANFGSFDLKNIDRNNLILDRYFAAVDVTTDAAGNPICRSELNGTRPATTPFGIPLFDSGFFTFSPGDGSCVPINLLAGPNSSTQAAVDWVTTTTQHDYEIEQTVFSAIIDGDLGFGLDAGDIAFAAGAEWREETSESTFDPLVRGVLPVTTPDGNAGDLIRDLPAFSQSTLVFDGEIIANNSSGSFDVWEVFVEAEVPLLAGVTGADELTWNGAVRYSDYSTVGETTTWKTGFSWAPIEDIRFRGTISQAIRAPNIFELFEPDQGATFRPDDPCVQTEIDALIAGGDPRGQLRQANCAADGIPAGFVDPLTARFSGVVSGNPLLIEETADTLTVGFVFQPTFLDGFTASVDFWDIEIADAISAVDDQDIVDNCYDTANFPNQFCTLFTRNRDSLSPQFLGLNFLRQSQLNFGKIESAGVDFSAQYVFDVGANNFSVGISGASVDYLDFFFDPGDPTAVDPELGEIRRPELSGNISVQWVRGPVLVRWLTHYQDVQGLQDVEIEDVDITFGPAGFADEVYIHYLSGSYEWNDSLQIFGGVNNVSDDIPFITEQAYPVSPTGRYYFIGVNYRMQ